MLKDHHWFSCQKDSGKVINDFPAINSKKIIYKNIELVNTYNTCMILTNINSILNG